MSDIQRWTLPHDGYAFQSDDGGYVTYADHVAALLTQDQQHMEQQAAAVAAAEQRAGEEAHGHYMDGYNTAWSLSAAEIERQVREEEQVAQSLAVAESFAAGEALAAIDAGKALSAARDAVAAECIAHHGYTPGQTCPYCTDALAAIDALRGEA